MGASEFRGGGLQAASVSGPSRLLPPASCSGEPAAKVGPTNALGVGAAPKSFFLGSVLEGPPFYAGASRCQGRCLFSEGGVQGAPRRDPARTPRAAAGSLRLGRPRGLSAPLQAALRPTVSPAPTSLVQRPATRAASWVSPVQPRILGHCQAASGKARSLLRLSRNGGPPATCLACPLNRLSRPPTWLPDGISETSGCAHGPGVVNTSGHAATDCTALTRGPVFSQRGKGSRGSSLKT